jgi:serine/threonine protein phosphatase PrpC
MSERAIVLASDGLWDNLHEEEIGQLAVSGGDMVGRVRTMVKRAKEMAYLLEYESPFYLKAVKKGHSVPKGGKIDDITIIIAEVVLTSG